MIVISDNLGQSAVSPKLTAWLGIKKGPVFLTGNSVRCFFPFIHQRRSSMEVHLC
jgi:hypothetical protein